MFWSQFWLTNLHFAGELFVALTSLLATYVLLGVWKERKEKKIALRALGFGLFTLFSAFHATGPSTSSGQASVALFVEFLALLLIGISFWIDPIQPPPDGSLAKETPRRFSHLGGEILRHFRGISLAGWKKRRGKRGAKALRAGPSTAPLIAVWGDFLKGGLSFANLAILAATVRRIYLKYTKGLESELKNLFRGFGLFFLSEVVLILTLFQGSSYLLLSAIGAPLGGAWLLSHALKFAGFVFVAIWAWGYLRFKLFSQVVGAFVTASLFIFILITFTYTSLLVGSAQRNALENLRINLRTFEYSVERLKSEALAQAKVAASSAEVKVAVKANNKARLKALAADFMLSAGTSFLAITDKSGIVLARGEDPEAAGDSLSGNLVIASALEGEGRTNVATREWIAAPQVLIEAAAPLDSLGAVYTGYILDSAFVDGVKEATGLEVTAFGDSVKSATTLVAADGVSRLVGVEEANERIKNKVLEKGELFLGLSSVSQREYLAAYGPLKDVGEKVLGMLFVGYPSSLLFEAAQSSLNTTFLVSAILALLSFIPAWLLAKYIEEHQV